MRQPKRPYSRFRLALSLAGTVILFALSTAVAVFGLLLYATTGV